MNTGKKKYFISDAHLGLYPPENSIERERILVNWLESIKNDTEELYLLGDIFDYWHEYKHVVPRGFVRFLGKLAELSDTGIKIYFFTGNHDIWAYDYLPSELGIEIYRNHLIKSFNGKRFLIGHGDGIGKAEIGYKLMKWVFTNRVLQWLFARIHPNASVSFGKKWSKSRRYTKGIIAEPYRGDDQEFQIMFAKETIKKEHFDYFIFGHRHLPYEINISPKSKVINIGDWINHFTYAVWDGNELQVHSIFPDKEQEILRKSI